MDATAVDLVEAAARLRVPYHTAHRLVLTGDLKGERRNGRWFVDCADLERVARERGERDKWKKLADQSTEQRRPGGPTQATDPYPAIRKQVEALTVAAFQEGAQSFAAPEQVQHLRDATDAARAALNRRVEEVVMRALGMDYGGGTDAKRTAAQALLNEEPDDAGTT